MDHRTGLPSYSAIDHGRTVRPTSTSLLTIDSEDRFESYERQYLDDGLGTAYNRSPYSYTINKNQAMIAVPPTRIAATEVAFPWTIGNINKKTSQILVFVKQTGIPFNPTTGTILLTLTPGFYKPSELASQIQTAVREFVAGISATFTMTYGALNQPLFTYDTGSNAYSIAFGPLLWNSGINPGAASTTAYPYPATTKQLFNVLGMTAVNGPFSAQFNADTLANVATNTSITLCNACRYVDIVCDSLTGLQGIQDSTSQPITRNALCRLYIVNPYDNSQISPSNAAFCPPGCAPIPNLYRAFPKPKEIQWIPNQPLSGNLTFTVFDDTGAPLSELDPYILPTSTTSLNGNTTNWSITLLLTEN